MKETFYQTAPPLLGIQFTEQKIALKSLQTGQQHRQVYAKMKNALITSLVTPEMIQLEQLIPHLINVTLLRFSTDTLNGKIKHQSLVLTQLL